MKYSSKNRRWFFVLLVCIHYSLSAQGTLEISEIISSNTLNTNESYSMYLPENYNKAGDYPILYLLHGYGGSENSWIKRGSIHLILDSLIHANSLPEVIVVFPNGRNSYYMNDYKHVYPFEDYFINEFVSFIDSTYASSNKESERAIAGLSMGGFGATLIPIKHPDIFGTAINLSGAVRTQDDIIALTPTKYFQYFSPIYGDSLIGQQRITQHWLNNSPYELIDSTNRKDIARINWYIDCGMQDFLFNSNQSLHHFFLQNNIPHEYHMRQGGHSWEYWRSGIINALVYWGTILDKNN